MQWDWLELPDAPDHWASGAAAHLLVGALPHSGKWRAVLAEAETLPHLVQGLHQVSAGLGGVPKTWRFDRMATVANPNTGRVTATFAAVAKHYGVHVALCPPRHGNRKGTVEKANHSAAQRWWRTVPDDFTMSQARMSLDAFCSAVGDNRARRRDGQASAVGALGDAEMARLSGLPEGAASVPGHTNRHPGRVRSSIVRLPRKSRHWVMRPGWPGATIARS